MACLEGMAGYMVWTGGHGMVYATAWRGMGWYMVWPGGMTCIWYGRAVMVWYMVWSGGHSVTGRPCGSVAQWSECSRSGHVLFPSPVTFSGSVWVRARAASCKGTVSSVPAWFRADSGTNLIKQGEMVTGRPCGSAAQWSECSHGLREVLGSSTGRAMCFFLPCGNGMVYGVVWRAWHGILYSLMGIAW